MADDPEEQATVADPPKPGAEGEQEPKAEEPTTEAQPEGGAAPEQEGEEFDADAEFLAAAKELTPEERLARYNDLYGLMSDDEKDGLRPAAVAEKAAAGDAEAQRNREFQALMQSTSSASAERKASAEAFVNGISTEITYDGDGKPQSSLNKDTITERLAAERLNGQEDWHNFMVALQSLQVRAGLESHPIHGKLSAEQKAALEKLGDDPGDKPADWIAARQHIYLDAAVAAAPDEILAKALVEAEEKIGTKERLSKLADAIGPGRKRKALGEGTLAGTFATMTDADAAYNRGDISIERYKELRKQFEVPDIAR